MTFDEAEDYLLGLELFGMRFGLDRMFGLMTALGMPQHRFASVHVVGSNGKSSTTRFTTAILRRHGLRTAGYTSPHLRSFRERIEVGEKPVSQERFATAVDRAAQAAAIVERRLDADDRVTQFEALTAAAFHEMAASRVDVAVIEAGLGGRHDATNVIPSRVQALTGVGLEHTRWLGPTPVHIAEEKLAVVRDHATLVVGPLDPEVHAVAQRAAADHHATLVTAPALGETPATRGLEMRAAGAFQRTNFALAAAAAEAFLDRPLDPAAVRAAASETGVPGRLEIVDGEPLTLLDAAHNPDGARALVAALGEIAGDHAPLVLVASILEDKDAAGLLETLLPIAGHVVFTRCSNPRALPPGTLESLSGTLGGPAAETVAEPRAAVTRARELAGPGGAVLATGSIYLVADLVRNPAQNRASTL
ncbi:MAG: dihydrofolate synthase [Actinomycetota bacterium]|nr:dihydrofolate synthase [Actinomycetota bacterium]